MLGVRLLHRKLRLVYSRPRPLPQGEQYWLVVSYNLALDGEPQRISWVRLSVGAALAAKGLGKKLRGQGRSTEKSCWLRTSLPRQNRLGSQNDNLWLAAPLLLQLCSVLLFVQGKEMHAESYRLRLGRCSEAGRPYLLTTATYRREPLLGDIYLGRLLVTELRAADAEGWVTSLAWVVMPDHLHWLVELRDRSLDSLMRRIKSNSSRHINQHLERRGRVWQPGFHDRAIRREEDLQSVARYIVGNPLRAGLVEHIGAYSLWDACWL